MNTMNEDEELRKLDSEDSTIRAIAALRLKESFDERIGDRLVRMLIEERDSGSFVLVCIAVIPKWIVKFERRVAGLDAWPFDDFRTGWLLRGLKGWRLPSIESRMHQFLDAEDWTLKLSAVDYCHDKMKFGDRARDVCLQFLAEYRGSAEDKLKLVRSLRAETLRRLRAHVRRCARDFESADTAVLTD